MPLLKKDFFNYKFVILKKHTNLLADNFLKLELYILKPGNKNA